MTDSLLAQRHLPRSGVAAAVRGAAKMTLRAVLGEPGVEAGRRALDLGRVAAARRRRIRKPTDPRFLEILDDPAFQAAVSEVRRLTPSDTARLANLWQLCQLVDPLQGAIVDVGAYRGGTTLLLARAVPSARLFCCDTFDGFRRIELHANDVREAAWRAAHGRDDPFQDGRPAAVRRLLHGFDATVLEGFFPDSDAENRIGAVAFAHIDVMLYDSCKRSLDYLADRARPDAIIVVNDYRRNTVGVTRATEEFLAERPAWQGFPLYPGQGLFVQKARFG